MADEKETASTGDNLQNEGAAKQKEEQTTSGGLDSNASEQVAIKNDSLSKKIDENSERLTQLVTTSSLNDNQKKEVKELLKAELEQSVSTLKSEMKKESEDTKKDFLTFFGLFASFVTFLSIEIQLFKNSDNILELVGVSSLSLSFVMFFALILNEMIKGDYQLKDLRKPKYLINLAFLVVGVACLFFGSFRETNGLSKLKARQHEDSVRVVELNLELVKSREKISKLDSLITLTRKSMTEKEKTVVNPTQPKDKRKTQTD
jgi:hypothetical protein